MGVIGWIRTIITWAIIGGVLLASVIAMIDAARVPARAFSDAGKKAEKDLVAYSWCRVVVCAIGRLTND